MSTEITTKVTFDSKGLISQVEKHENLKAKIESNVNILLDKLPKDLTSLPVQAGDEAEAQVQSVINKIKDAANANQEARMQYTRRFDEIKKQFTTAEASIKDKLKELDEFVINWNAEKLKRQRQEEEKIRLAQEKKQKLIQLKHDIKTYYLTFVIKYFNEQVSALESSFYNKNTDELKQWGEKFKDFKVAPLRKKWMSEFSKNPYPENLQGELNEVENTIFQEEIVKCIDEKLSDIAIKIKELIVFIPSRIEALKELDENAKNEEAQKLKEKQQKELEEAQAKQKQELEDKLMEDRTSAVVESIDAEASTELSKGASVKLKYNPKNHTHLLKVINWYLQNQFIEEDFQTIEKRLSFMLTSADRSLNKDGEVIAGVPTEEVVSKRRTK